MSSHYPENQKKKPVESRRTPPAAAIRLDYQENRKFS